MSTGSDQRSGELTEVCAALDRLASVPLSQLSRSDAHHILHALDACICASLTHQHSNVEDRKGGAGSEGGIKAVARQQQISLVHSLSQKRQDALMKVLYACMTPPPPAVVTTTSKANTLDVVAVADEGDEPKARLRSAYAWFDVLYEVAGDGAVVRVLASS